MGTGPNEQDAYHESGVDWLSATARRDSPWWESERIAMLHALQMVMRAGGGELRPGGLLGYRGHQTEGAYWGEREDGCLFQATGHRAHMVVPVLAPHVGIRPSRLDIQCTVWGWDATPAVRHEYALALEDAARAPEERRRQVFLFSGNAGGGTCYIGSPRSPQRGRIYDKGAESRDPRYSGALRYEVQFRNDPARAVWEEITERDDPQTQEAFIAGVVREWFSGRGCAVLPLWAVEDTGWRPPRAARTNNERRLAWLDAQVKPAIARLLTDGVPPAVVLAALGLTPGPE